MGRKKGKQGKRPGEEAKENKEQTQGQIQSEPRVFQWI